MEQRHQWQRRNFHEGTGVDAADVVATSAISDITLDAKCNYDKYGNKLDSEAAQPGFLLVDQIIAIQATHDADGSGTDDAAVLGTLVAKVKTVNGAAVVISPLSFNGTELDVSNTDAQLAIAANAPAEVIGSAFAEGTSFPEGWADELYAREGHCQIFKTASPVMSGSAQATRYRGIANEWQRVWKEKLMEHKMDIEKAMLFGMGGAQSTAGTDVRRTWGIVPYTEKYGKVYNYAWDTTGTASAKSTYNTFLEIMEDFYAPEAGNSGNKLCLASRSVISYFNKIGTGGLVGDSISNPFHVDVNYKDGKFGHKVMQVDTVFGGFTLVQEPLFRGPYADMMVMVDMDNVKYRPLVGNGISRDTYIETNVQTPGQDARVDQILTEAGLQVQLPETHAIVKFNGNTAVTEG